MPKERLHILLAEECCRFFISADGRTACDEERRLSYLMGSIFPDVLFYDLPSFRLSHVGAQLHRYEGESILPLASTLLNECARSSDRDCCAWVLGLTSHYLADGYMHPTIVRFSSRISPPCDTLHLTMKDCHHWFESELEAHWIDLLGPSGGYLDLLDRFRAEARPQSKYIGYFKRFADRAGVRVVLQEDRIAKCLFWQTFLLREFARGRWGRWRPWLLKRSGGRFLGSLIVPMRPDPAMTSVSRVGNTEVALNPFHHRFMAGAVTYLATHLRSLPVPLW